MTVLSSAGGGSSRRSGLDVSWRSKLSTSSSWEVFPTVSSSAGLPDASYPEVLLTVSSSAGGGSSRRSVSGSLLDGLVLGGSSRRFDSGSLLVLVVFFCFDAPFCVERKLARSRFFFQDLTMSYSSFLQASRCWGHVRLPWVTWKPCYVSGRWCSSLR